jgi:hypothetical protein
LESLEADVAEQLNDMQEKMPDLELRIGNVAEQLNDMKEKMPYLERRIGNEGENAIPGAAHWQRYEGENARPGAAHWHDTDALVEEANGEFLFVNR